MPAFLAAAGKMALGGAKLAGKAAVGSAKKIAADKLLNRKKKTDKRRAAAQKMMGGEEVGQVKGGALAVIPKAPLVQSPAGAIEKYSGGGEQQSGGEGLEETVLRIKRSVIQVESLLGNSVALQKKQLDDERKAREAAQSGKAEKDLEKKKPKTKGKGPKIKIPGKGILSGIMDFVINIAFGWIAVRLVKFAPQLGKILPWIGAAADFIINFGGLILSGLATLIDWGYKLVELGRGAVKGVFGEDGAEKFDIFMSNIKNIFAGFLIWKLIGEKIFKAIIGSIRNTFNVIKSVFAKAGKFLNWMTGGRAGNIAKNVLGKGKNLVGNIGRRLGVGAKRLAGKGVRSLVKGVGKTGQSIMKKGVGKAAKRAVIKMFGKTAGKIFGKIPIIGPVIVGIISILSGEPLGQALFKTFGAAIGGLLGTFIPIPIVGTLLGEAVGVFAGDLLYHLIVKKDPKAAFQMLKDTLMGIFGFITKIPILGDIIRIAMKGGNILWEFGKWIFFDAIPWVMKKLGGAAKLLKEWFQRGMTRFSDNFPVFNLPLMKFQILGIKFNINEFLGKTIGQIPWFKQWVDGDNQLMHFPDFSMFVPGLGLPFLIGHTGKSLFPGSFFESWPSGVSSFVNPMGKAFGDGMNERKEKAARLKAEREEKKAKQKKKIEEEGWGPFGWGKKEQKETPKVKVTNLDSGGVLIQSGKTPTATQEGYDALVDKLGPDHKRTQFYKRRLEAENIQKNVNTNKIKSISRKAEYEELAPVVIEVPVIVKAGGNLPQGTTTVVSGGSGGESGNDPYEVLDFQG